MHIRTTSTPSLLIQIRRPICQLMISASIYGIWKLLIRYYDFIISINFFFLVETTLHDKINLKTEIMISKISTMYISIEWIWTKFKFIKGQYFGKFLKLYLFTNFSLPVIQHSGHQANQHGRIDRSDYCCRVSSSWLQCICLLKQ